MERKYSPTGTRRQSRKRLENLKAGFPLGEKPGIVEETMPTQIGGIYPKMSARIMGEPSDLAKRGVHLPKRKSVPTPFKDTR